MVSFKLHRAGITFLHKLPTSAASLAVFVSAKSPDGFDRIMRLFVLRTGVPVPEWVVVGPDADTKGGGGILGAG